MATSTGEYVMSGVYRLSRQCLLFKPFLRAQERTCRETYGDAYGKHAERVPHLGSP
jgi:hypothetical protein